MNSRYDIAWTLIRVSFGLLFAINHGFAKIFGGPEKMAGFAKGVAEMGFPAPEFFAWSAALTEAAGGILLALGLFTRPMAVLAGFTMLVAIYRHLPDPFARMESAILFLVVWIAAFLVGGGRYSLDRALGVKLPFGLSK